METTLPVFIDMFASTKLTEGKSHKTVEWYQKRLKGFVSFVGDKATLKDFNLQNTRDFVASLQARKTRYSDHPISPTIDGGLSKATIHGYVRTLKTFASWLYEEGYTVSNVLSRLKRPSLDETVIEILSPEEQRRLLESVNQNCFLGARMYTIDLPPWNYSKK